MRLAYGTAADEWLFCLFCFLVLDLVVRVFHSLKKANFSFQRDAHVFHLQCCVVPPPRWRMTCCVQFTVPLLIFKSPFSILSSLQLPPPPPLSPFHPFILHRIQFNPWLLAYHHGVQITLFILGAKGKSLFFPSPFHFMLQLSEFVVVLTEKKLGLNVLVWFFFIFFFFFFGLV